MKGSNSLKRKSATRVPPKRFTIFAEGKNTEPEYFRAIKNLYKGPLIDIQIAGGEGGPATLADKAIAFLKGEAPGGRGRAKLNSFEKGDEVWVVFDRDDHPKVKELIERCVSKAVLVGYSNPCFEVWLILHFQDFDRDVDRHTVQRELEKICPGYTVKSGKKADCDSLMNAVESAEDRAEKMIKRRQNEGAEMNPPYTSVHNLTKAIRKASRPEAKS